MTDDETAKDPSAASVGPQPADPAPQTGLAVTTPPLSHGGTTRRTRCREAVSTVTELAGLGVLSAGFWMIRPWAGLIVLGVGLIVLGFASSPRFNRLEEPR